MLFGFLLATPPGFIPDDWIDVIVATHLSGLLNIGFALSLLLTYTVVAWSIIIIGASIYPYNTVRLLNGKLNQLKSLIAKCFTQPVYFAGLVIGLLLMYWFAGWYQGYLLKELTTGGWL
jgi:uncharacterized membrane protein